MTDSMMQTAIGVSALLLLVLFLRRPVARHFGPRWAYALWILPILRLIMPQISIPSHWLPTFNLRPDPVIAPPPFAQTPTLQEWVILADPAPVEITSNEPSLILPLLTLIWLSGMMIGTVWAIWAHLSQRKRLQKFAVVAPQYLHADIDRAARLSELKVTPDVRLSLDKDGPLVCGLIKPIIILPHDFETRFSPDQRRLALLHECLHIKRGDLWTATAMLGFRLLNWPNPLVHWAWPRFRADQEAACDASVLRIIGDQARGDYAETLLTAATTSGRASPISGTGLTLSLHHPVKERLMTLGSQTQSNNGVKRWALASLLLAGTALCAPLSLASDQAPPTPPEPDTPPAAEAPVSGKTVSKNVMRWIKKDDKTGESEGFEIREKDGVKTYLRVSRDGTTEELTREELAAEYGEDFDEVIIAPQIHVKRLKLGEDDVVGLAKDMEARHHLRTMFLGKHKDGGGQYEVEVEDGETKVFRIDEDGTRTELEIGEMDNVEVKVLEGQNSFFFSDDSDKFPHALKNRKVMVLNSDEDISVWTDEDGNVSAHGFAFGLKGNLGTAAAEARLRSAQSMIEATDRMLEDMREDAEGSADGDLRKAERELEKARKALEKAMEAVRDSENR